MEFARICFLRDEAIQFDVVIKGPCTLYVSSVT